MDPFEHDRNKRLADQHRASSPVAKLPWWAALIAGLLFIWLCGVVVGACKSLGSTGPTEVAVVYNGGWLDNREARGVVGPASGYEVPGLYSTWHKYFSDAEQRYYQISTDPDKADDPAATAVSVPTKDGVQVDVEALTNFHTTFTGEDDDENLREFDLRFGNRTFGSEGQHVWDSDGGWEAFLDAQFRPVLVSTFREEIGSLNCEQLVSSCALIQQQGTGPGGTPQLAGTDNETSFQRVADAVQAKLEQRVSAALGGEYLTGFQVNIEFVKLPEPVQAKIDAAQAEYAEIAAQRASARAAEFEAKRTRILAEQYRASPEYALIKAVETISNCGPECATVILDASGAGLGLNVGGR